MSYAEMNHGTQMDARPYAEPLPENLDLTVLQNDLGNCLSMIDDEVMKGYVSVLNNLPLVDLKQFDLKGLENVQFFRITELVYQEDEFSVDKLSMVFHALSGCACTLSLMLKSDGCETDFYLGVRSNDPDRTTGTLLKMLKKTLLGFFPGSRIETFYDEDCKKMMNELKVRSISSVTSVADYKRNEDTVTNKDFIQGLEKFVYAMQGTAYTAVFLADSVGYGQLMERRREYESICTQISPFANMQLNFSVSDGQSASSGISKGAARTTSHTDTSGTSASRSDGWTQTQGATQTTGWSKTQGTSSSKGTTDGTSDTHTVSDTESNGTTHTVSASDGTSRTVSNTVSAGVGVNSGTSVTNGFGFIFSHNRGHSAGVGVNAGYSHGVSKGTSHTDTVSDAITKTLSHGVSNAHGTSHSTTLTQGSTESNGTTGSNSTTESYGTTHSTVSGTTHSTAETIGETFNLVNTESMTNTFGNSRAITLNAQNATLTGTLDRLKKHLKRIDECESIGMWNFAAYFLGETTADAQTAANTYKAVVAGENSGIEKSAVNSWSEHDRVVQLMEYLQHFPPAVRVSRH